VSYICNVRGPYLITNLFNITRIFFDQAYNENVKQGRFVFIVISKFTLNKFLFKEKICRTFWCFLRPIIPSIKTSTIFRPITLTLPSFSQAPTLLMSLLITLVLIPKHSPWMSKKISFLINILEYINSISYYFFSYM
jgi:hypothetical protein